MENLGLFSVLLYELAKIAIPAFGVGYLAIKIHDGLEKKRQRKHAQEQAKNWQEWRHIA